MIYLPFALSLGIGMVYWAETADGVISSEAIAGFSNFQIAARALSLIALMLIPNIMTVMTIRMFSNATNPVDGIVHPILLTQI
jgi:hypothetical protein